MSIKCLKNSVEHERMIYLWRGPRLGFTIGKRVLWTMDGSGVILYFATSVHH